MKALRASLLYFKGRQAVFEQDGLLVVGSNAQGRQVVQAIGSYQGSFQGLRSSIPKYAD